MLLKLTEGPEYKSNIYQESDTVVPTIDVSLWLMEYDVFHMSQTNVKSLLFRYINLFG